MGLALLAAAVLAGAGLTALAAGPGYRWGWWPLGTAFATVRWGVHAGLGAAALGLVAAALPPWRGGWVARAVGAAVVAGGIALAVPPYLAQRLAEGAPPVNDVTTDPDDPPALVALLPLRAGAPNPPDYPDGMAARQRAAMPDIRPVVLPLPAEAAMRRVRALVDSLGWTVVAQDGARIEAIAVTRWFGFQDDVVLRLTEVAGGTRVDIRSKARLGRGDRGMNAWRVRDFLARLRGE